MLKTCFKCLRELPRDAFYRHAQMADGLLGKCKDCAKRDVTAHRLANLDTVRAYDRSRAKAPLRQAKRARNTKRWRAEDRRRCRAHDAVYKALKKGSLVKKPCACGSLKSLAHHESYDRPLDVVWYCQPCHVRRHQDLLHGRVVP